ncbi:MAG: TetR/AcrR family transcriptional regulator [Rhodospirillales bacterium]
MAAAEAMIRARGYNAFSFREVAESVGVKSASVHYHFPSKADLGAAVVRAYTESFLAALGDPLATETDPRALLARYVAAYRKALIDQDLMCLCGMLGAEIAALPASVSQETRRFFELHIDWLVQVYGRQGLSAEAARRRALTTISTLEGAMILSRSLDDLSVFDEAAATITA